MVTGKNLKDLYQLFSILHQYSSAGVNVADGISLYAQECRPKMKKMLEGVLHDLRNGSDLPGAMARRPELFPPFIVEMMRVNDQTGQAGSIYESIEQTLEEEMDLRRNVGSEMIPIVVLFVALIIAFCVATFVVIPMMGEMLSDMHVKLPLLTRFFIGLSDILLEYWYAVLLGAGAAIGGILYLRSARPELFAKAVLRMPFYGIIVYYRLQHRFARIFGICIEAGIETSHALQFAATAADNVLMKNALEQAVQAISRSGASLTQAIKKANGDGIIDPSFYAMLEAGQQGNMDKILENRAGYFKKQLLAVSKTFGTKVSLSLMTPGFILLMGILLSVYMPVFELMGSISGRGGMGF